MTSSLRRRTALVVVPAASVLALICLAGCSSLTETMRNEASHEFATQAELADGWDRSAPWVPNDAVDISTHESSSGDPASLIAVSGTRLDPTQCVEVERQSSPSFTLDDAPNVYKADTVFACGDWAVVPTGDGWYGWTPNHPDEKAASPAP